MTAENLEEYLTLFTERRLSQWRDSIDSQLAAMAGGLGVLLAPTLAERAAKAFTVEEIQLLLGGVPQIGDELLQDWERNTEYGGDLSSSHPSVCSFWEVVRGFSAEERARLLAFVTGCPRPPALGFGRLPSFNGGQGRFRLVSLGGNAGRLPTASTCFNTLRLPPFRGAEELRTMLVRAMSDAGGFAEAAVADG